MLEGVTVAGKAEAPRPESPQAAGYRLLALVLPYLAW